MKLQEAAINLDKAIDGFRKSLYNKRTCKITKDEKIVYSSLILKLEDITDFLKFITEGIDNEYRNETGKSPFKSSK